MLYPRYWHACPSQDYEKQEINKASKNSDELVRGIFAAHCYSEHSAAIYSAISSGPTPLALSAAFRFGNNGKKLMDVIPSDDVQDWQSSIIPGSLLQLECGIAGTTQSPQEHPSTSFSGSSTVILGAASSAGMESISETIASWRVPMDARSVRYFDRGFLIIASVRYFGGLHSGTYNSRAEIFINDKVVDGFGLRDKPPNHSDYFHRAPTPNNLPNILPVSNCQTVYAWPVLREKLVHSNHQLVTIKIGNYVRWDIDYLGFFFRISNPRHHVFLSHNWNDKPVARKLADDLQVRGINVWVDEAEIKLGESLIEKICEAIDSVEYVNVLLSKNSIGSSWVKKEVDIAMNQEIEGRRVKVVPILLDAVDLPGF